MAKEIYISSTPHETRLAIVEEDQAAEIHYERENEYTLAGSVYKGRVTRVLPGMQSAFVDIGLERDAFLYVTDFLEEQEDSSDFERIALPAAGEEKTQERNGERGGNRPTRDGRAVGFTAEAPVRELTLGESAPASTGDSEDGVDAGSRRWRGRRGRRRGRGGDRGRSETAGQAPGQTPGQTSGQTSGETSGETNEFKADQGPSAGEEPELLDHLEHTTESHDAGTDNFDAGHEFEAGHELGRSDPDAAEFEDNASEAPAVLDAPQREDRAGRRDSGRARDTRGAYASPAALVLPGESLSKYGGKPAGEPAAGEGAGAGTISPARPAPAPATSRPSTIMETPALGWDGGAVLPGESLSRHRSRPPAESVRLDDAGEHVTAQTEHNLHPQQTVAGIAARNPEAEQPLAPSAERFSGGETGATLLASTPSDASVEFAAERAAAEAAPEATFALPSAGSPFGSPYEPEINEEAFEAEEQRQNATDEAAYERQTGEEHFADYGKHADPQPARDAALTAAASVVPRADEKPRADAANEEHPATANAEEHPEGHHSYLETLAEKARAVLAELHLIEPAQQKGPGAGEEQTWDIAAAESTAADKEGRAAQPRASHPEPLEHHDLPPRTAAEFEHAGQPAPSAASSSEPGDFEPAEGSASHRIEPNPPSEFRFWRRDSDRDKDRDAARAAEPSARALPEADVHRPQTAAGNAPASETHGFAHTHAVLPETTSLQRDGTLLSEVPAEVVTDQTGVSAGALVADPTGGNGVHGAELQRFSPGDGVLEEETIEDEEFDFEPIHGHSDEQDVDDLEEESHQLEGGEFSDLLRDAQIEAETRYQADGLADEVAETGDDENFIEEDEELDDAEAEEAVAEEAEGAGASSAGVPQRAPRRGTDRRGRGGRRTGGGGQGGHGRGRQSMQTTDLPAINELLKQGQEILVQIAKEPIARKGARITSHIALPGRFLVFMPTVNHVGVSRKISSDEERRRLKHILLSEKGEAPGGFIVRTAAGTATEDELRSDIRFLISLWTDIKQRSDSGKAPALIYHDLSLVERVLRDQVSDTFSSIWVDNEADYERVLRFLQRFQPSMVRRVKLYTKETPLFEQFGIQDEINKALKSKVWLKSGGSIVINQTEALVAIDINTGKYVGKTARLEDTIIKTNLDAIPEIVRQIRLRDLGGIIVIDFIDMDERKNRHRVMQALEEELKKDRAPSKVLQFNDFGLVAITRKRVKQSLERTLSTQCTVCTGTGMVKSSVTVCNEIYIEMRKMYRHLEGKDVLLRVHPEVVKQLKSGSGRWLNELEEVAGKTIILKSDPSLQPEQFDIH